VLLLRSVRPEAMEAIPKFWTPVAQCLPSPMVVVEVNPILWSGNYAASRPLLALLAGHPTQTL
jgi:hypothetical protein